MPDTSGRQRRNGGHASPSMDDVADLAGVALGTVSNVLNHPEKVAKATRNRVQFAIAELGFVRNSNARALAAGTTNIVALIVPDITNTVFVDLSKGAQSAARELGLNLVLANIDDDFSQQERYLDLFDEARVSGILLAPMHDSHDGVERVRSHGRSVVLVNYSDHKLDCCTVLMDNELDGYMATRHLLDLGMRRLVFIGGPDLLQPVRDRRMGMRRAAAEAGVTIDEIDPYNVASSEGRLVGAELAARWREERTRLGVVASTDLLALGIIQSLTMNTELRIPEDVAVIGCDGNRAAWEGAIPLSTVEPPGFGMGVNAMHLLIEEIQGETPHVHRRIVLPPTLIVKESTRGRLLPPTSPAA